MWFNMRICQSTKEKLDLLSKQSGLSRSSVIRHLIDGAVIREMPPLDYHNLIKELRRIGTNINQIAAYANSVGSIDTNAYQKNAAELRAAVLDIKRAVELR